MGQNGYFQLIPQNDKLYLHIIAPESDGAMFAIEELIHYLDLKRITTYDLIPMNQFIQSGNYDEDFLLDADHAFTENEEMQITIQPKALSCIVRFYAPSPEGGLLTKEEILRTLHKKGVVHGINETIIDSFLANRQYCTDYIVAEATQPRHGKDAVITYHFDTNVTARPKLNEDGSVDFHQLGHIKPVRVNDRLATLTPADLGTPGTDVIGHAIKPKKVRNLRLRYSRNIKCSENKLELYSMVAGHVTLVDDMVMVSDVYQVPKNVDASTGDIEYSGSVEIPGNVLTGYSIKADGDVIVNGVVEGATIISGGNVVLKNGMQGMSRGVIKAKGNVIAKYLENCNVEAGGSVMSDAMMHTNVCCKDKVEVSGRKGVITGGHIQTYGNIIASNIGSTMGTSTVVEIMPDTQMAKELNKLEKEMEEKASEIKKLDQIIVALTKKVKMGEKLTAEQENYLKLAALNRQKLATIYAENDAHAESLRIQLESCKNVSICVNGNVYSGVKIMIKDVMKIVRDNVSHCRLVREGADIRMNAI